MRPDDPKPTAPAAGAPVQTEVKYQSAKGCLLLGGLILLLTLISAAAIALLGDFSG